MSLNIDGFDVLFAISCFVTAKYTRVYKQTINRFARIIWFLPFHIDLGAYIKMHLVDKISENTRNI